TCSEAPSPGSGGRCPKARALAAVFPPAAGSPRPSRGGRHIAGPPDRAAGASDARTNPGCRLIRLSWPFLLGRIHAMPDDPVRPARTGDGPRPALSERDLVVEVAGITAAATAAAAFLGRAGLAEIRAASAALIAAAL